MPKKKPRSAPPPPPAPRHLPVGVRRALYANNVALIGSVLFAAGALACLWAPPAQSPITSFWLALGKQQTVADVVSIQGTAKAGTKGAHSYHVEYRFGGPGHQLQTGSSDVSDLGSGRGLQVEYSRYRPEANRLVGSGSQWTVLLLLVPLVGATVTAAGFRSARRRIRVLEAGGAAADLPPGMAVGPNGDVALANPARSAIRMALMICCWALPIFLAVAHAQPR